jgi:hypothetical protein
MVIAGVIAHEADMPTNTTGATNAIALAVCLCLCRLALPLAHLPVLLWVPLMWLAR